MNCLEVIMKIMFLIEIIEIHKVHISQGHSEGHSETKPGVGNVPGSLVECTAPGLVVRPCRQPQTLTYMCPVIS